MVQSRIDGEKKNVVEAISLESGMVFIMYIELINLRTVFQSFSSFVSGIFLYFSDNRMVSF